MTTEPITLRYSIDLGAALAAGHATCAAARPAALRPRSSGKCRAPGCTAQAVDRGYCRRCAFDEFDD